MGIVMVFKCPETGHEVSSGVVLERDNLELPRGRVEVRCMECGRTHVWETGQARFAYTNIEERLPVPVRLA